MGFISSVGHAFSDAGKGLGKVVQGGSDIFFNGPAGIAMRQELDHLHHQINSIIGQYNNIHGQVTSWRDPLNTCGKYTAALLHQSSDFVHGIALNYKEVMSDNSINIKNIDNLSSANVVKPLVDIPIPGDFGGFPSALVPGVEALKMIEGLINVFGSSIDLGSKLSQARSNLYKAEESLRQVQGLLSDMVALKNYFLQIANNVLIVYKRTSGLSLPVLAANSYGDLANVNREMEKLITQLTNANGNSFTICRFILNLAKVKNVSSPTEVQIQWIASQLFATVDNIKTAFESEAHVVTFVQNYFGGNLLTPAIMLHLPPAPSNLQKYITETKPSHETFTDPNSAQYDPPSSININNFPS